jgi:hypothetical protein
MIKNFKIIIIFISLLVLLKLYIEFRSFYTDSGLSLNLNNNIVPLNELRNIIHLQDDLLSIDECKKIKNIILNHRNLWKKKKYILYSFGNSSYLNDPMDQNSIQESNKFMLNLFPNLYSKLLFFLKDKLQRDVKFKEDGYIPGFHIFPETKIFQYNVADFHTDGQYTRNDWYGKCDFNNTISFTLAIDLPKDTSGLYIFEATDKTPLEKAKKSKKALIKYDIGKIFLHTGNNYHIMKPSKIEKGEYRLTFQGHGVLCDNIWYLFW